jgi:Helix-turn-helix of DDE superfamily endonuclease
MNDKYALLKTNSEVCKRLFGVKYDTFEVLLGKVQNHLNTHLIENPISNRGIDGEFSTANQLLLTLEYLRQYPTFLSLGFSYGISESYANKIYHNIRGILSELIGLKNPKEIKFKDVEKIIIDVTVQPIERPQKEQEKYYNRYKKNI